MAVLKECLLRSGQDINIFKKLDKMNTYGLVSKVSICQSNKFFFLIMLHRSMDTCKTHKSDKCETDSTSATPICLTTK